MSFITKLLANGAKFFPVGQNALRPIFGAVFQANQLSPSDKKGQSGAEGVLLNHVQSRDYKTKTRLRKRCRHCEFIWRNGRLFVECKENPRHKQFHMSSMLKGFDNIPYGYMKPK